MKAFLFLLPLCALCLTSCDTANKINQATCDINRNSDAVEMSTEAVNRNLVELEKVRASR